MDLTNNAHDYFITPFGEYILIYLSGKIKFLKITSDNVYIEPSKEELLKLNTMIDKKINTASIPNEYSQNTQNVEELVKNNPNLTYDEKLINQLKTIEQFIPKDYRQNFYKNLSTLKISYDNFDPELKDSRTAGLYNIEEIIKSTFNSETVEPKFLEYHINSTMFHELLHMASSYYDKETKMIYSGLSSFKIGDSIINTRLAINEGVTEMITHYFYPNILLNTSYLEEFFVASQLLLITGSDTLFQSYFSADEMKEINKNLYDLGLTFPEVYLLPGRVEINYRTKNLRETSANSTLARASGTLLKGISLKIDQAIDEGLINTTEELQTFFSGVLDKHVISKNKSSFFGHNLDKCLELEEVDSKLANLKNNAFNRLNVKYNKDYEASHTNDVENIESDIHNQQQTIDNRRTR